MIIVDAAAVLEVLAGQSPDAALVHRLGTDDIHTPHLIDVDVLHAVRVLSTRGAATDETLESARTSFELMELTRYPHTPLRTRIWELRHNLSAYDAAYVSLVEALDAPLVTTDARLGRATGTRASIDVFPRS